MLYQFRSLKKRLHNCYCKHASRTCWHCSVCPSCHGLKGRGRREWGSSSSGKSERRRIHWLEGYLSVLLSCQPALTPDSPHIQFSFTEAVANTAYKTLSGFSLPNPPAPSCMRRKATCIPSNISPKDLAKLFGSCLSACKQFTSRLRGAITRMWLICVEKSQ